MKTRTTGEVSIESHSFHYFPFIHIYSSLLISCTCPTIKYVVILGIGKHNLHDRITGWRWVQIKKTAWFMGGPLLSFDITCVSALWMNPEREMWCHFKACCEYIKVNTENSFIKIHCSSTTRTKMTVISWNGIFIIKKSFFVLNLKHYIDLLII